jgi:predicted O-methyltransferase YrrM
MFFLLFLKPFYFISLFFGLVYFVNTFNAYFMQVFSEKVNRLLVDLEKSSEQFWNIPREVAQVLYFMVRASNFSKVLEIGTSNGYSGIWIAKALFDKQEGCLVTIESNLDRYNLAMANFKLAEVESRIVQILGHAPEVIIQNELISRQKYGLVFMDATKKQHGEFLDAVWPLLEVGGVLVVDNVLSHAEKMQSFVEKIKQFPDLQWELLKVGDGLIVGVRIK